MPQAVQLRFAALSDPGKVRASNEDSWLADARLQLFAVCDGMGGAAGGEVASRMAADVLLREVRFRHSYDDPAALLPEAIQAAAAAIYRTAAEHPRLRGMGTTVAALLFTAHAGAILCHAGDSRCYRLRDRALTRLTRDHTVVEEEVQDRRMSAAEAEQSPLRHVLTRAAGVTAQLEVTTAVLAVEAGDAYLLCSDGLTNAVEDAELEQLLVRSLPAGAQATVEALVAEANRRGGEDNITAVLVELL